MRDPDLLLCAQRAAARLEDAWERWQTLRGDDGGSVGEVSSYVGYSQSEPRGRPRVVVGIDAEEAERLAALIDSGYALRAVADAGAAGGAAGSADHVANGNSPAVRNGTYQEAIEVRQETARAAGPEACEICGQHHAEDGPGEAGQAEPAPEAAPGLEPVPAQRPGPGQQAVPVPQPRPAAMPKLMRSQHPASQPPSPTQLPTLPELPTSAEMPTSAELPVPPQLPAAFGRPAGQAPVTPVEGLPMVPAPVQPAARSGAAQPASTRQFPAQPATAYPAAMYPASAYPIPGMTAVGSAGQGPARDSAEAGDAGPDASGAGATEPGATDPGGAPEPPAGKARAGRGAQAGPDDEDADDWATATAIPAELSGWASAAPPSQAYAGLAAWVAACSEPDDQDSGSSLPRSA
jgi:hypothetical protein